jgi:hypothetical protein
MRFLPLFTLSLGLTSCTLSLAQAPTKLPLNTVIVSGGPSPDYNQYAIESNARYVEKLTVGTTTKRVLFADGRKTSKTIVTEQSGPDQQAQTLFAWLFETTPPSSKTIYRPSTLNQINGSATKKVVLQNVAWLAGQAKNGQKSLLYFTGHGSAGQKRRLSLAGLRWEEDYDNTTYALWGDDEVSVKELAVPLKNWPAKTPLVLVMVQCHSGGFANLMFEGGDPKKPLLNRDFAGFFAATGDRNSSGCTPEVNEADYQDFTTHFFSALSGITRDGRRVAGADYDRNGGVSMLEAMAWTSLRDRSIDVPVCTSDTYLRTIFRQSRDMSWSKMPYSTLLKAAAPWQKATLQGLSKELGLKGETRIAAAMKIQEQAEMGMEDEDDSEASPSIDTDATYELYYKLKRDLQRRFPGLKAKSGSARFERAKVPAVKYIAAHQAEVAPLSKMLALYERSGDGASTREAMAIRFVRVTRTLVLEQQLRRQGTAAQKAAFARLRASESRNPLR